MKIKKIFLVVVISCILLSLNYYARVICNVDVISENGINIELKWNNSNTNNIKITGWMIVDKDVLKVSYTHGKNIESGWNRREIVNSSYSFPMKIILEDQTNSAVVLKDLPQDKESRFSILNLYDRGVINGYPGGEFRPSNPVTRAEFAAMLYKAAGYRPDISTKIEFKDVGRNHWGREPILTLAGKNILTGKGNNMFDPNGYVTVGEAIAIIDRTFTFFTNEKQYSNTLTNHWSNNNFRNLVSSNIVRTSDSFYYPYTPNKRATRKDCAILLSRALEQIAQVK